MPHFRLIEAIAKHLIESKETKRMDSYMILAEAAYGGYAKSTGGKTFDGRPMPNWSALPGAIQKAWRDATMAAIEKAIEIDLVTETP